MHAKVLRDPLVQYSRGLNWYGNIDAILNYTGADGTCCFGKGRGNTETPSKLFTNHNALGQLTNHNTFRFSEGGPSSNPELIESFVSGWGERYCNDVNYLKNNEFFEPPKQNQDFEKEHNRTPLSMHCKSHFLIISNIFHQKHYNILKTIMQKLQNIFQSWKQVVNSFVVICEIYY